MTHNNNRLFRFIIVTLLTAIGISLIYNIYTLFFPIETALEADAAEHLHAAYLLSIGKRPYLDFIQNHPMLFHHFLNWVENAFNVTSTRQLAAVGRVTIFAHFILCLAVFCFWTSEELKNRPRGIMWAAALLAPCALLDIYNPEFHWVWDLRPDFICYGQTLLGLYLIYRWAKRPSDSNSPRIFFPAILGGGLIGFGNAVIPKGIPFIAAFAMTLAIVGLSSGRDAVVSWLKKLRINYSLLIGGAVCISFVAGMLVDCHLSKVPLRKWVAAVFLLNSKKHIIFSNADNSPVTHLLNIFGVSLPIAVVFATWIIWELTTLKRSASFKNGPMTVWAFAIFTALVNVILPVYSNGVTWSYYFIPSFFSAAAICLMLILRLRAYFMYHPPFKAPSGLHAAVILVVGFLVFQILNSPFEFFSRFSARKSAAREIAMISASDFINEEVLPKDFTYLGYPDRMPIRSRNWGYYFMLAHSTNFWNDCHALGLGPDPRKLWGSGFSAHPPDAITLTRKGEVSKFVFVVNMCQGIDISWLPDEIGERYVLMGRPGASLYVLKEKVPYLETLNWRKIGD